MDARTFLPAPALAVASPPALGDLAPELPVSLEPGRSAVVAFLRHTGCPFSEATLRALRDAAAASPEVQWVAISHAPADATDRWCRGVGGSAGVQIVSDQSRWSYAAWGLGQTRITHFLGRRSLGAVTRLARQGIRNTHPTGTRWQSAGTFAIDRERIVRWRHLPEHAGDLPELDAARVAVA
ncbi:MAG TPA: AhpC/TSA family protein [Solirubrobacteraceae bacterium]|nr:AhpC/TSA family protein [Solirubrobacteraceae bacterium]